MWDRNFISHVLIYIYKNKAVLHFIFRNNTEIEIARKLLNKMIESNTDISY